MNQIDDFKKQTENVFLATKQVVRVTTSSLDDLVRVAYKHKRKRARLCLHENLQSEIQEMIIALVKGVYVRPLRQYIERYIRYTVLEGVADIIEFDEQGNIEKSYKVGDSCSGYPSYFKVSAKTYRSMIVLSNSFIFYEVNEGPFSDDMTEFAQWSDKESNTNALLNMQLKLMSYRLGLHDICIRKAKRNDFLELYSLYVEAMRKHVERIYGWDDEKQFNLFKERFQIEDQFVFTENDEIIGRLQYWWEEDHYFLDNIALSYRVRNKGLGAKIIERIMGDSTIKLQVYKESEAIKFYRRLNFLPIKEKDNHIVLKRFKVNSSLWKVLYFTNEQRVDDAEIPSFLRSQGHEVIVWHERVTAGVIEELGIDFIVSDRSRTLIKKDVLELMEGRIVNLHPSYLPFNKGYHPIFFSILEGTPAGTSLHFIDEGIDTGSIIAQKKIHYSDSDTLQSAYDKTRSETISLFKKEWVNIRRGCFNPVQQETAGTFHWKKDFEKFEGRLPLGWNTTISWIKEHFLEPSVEVSECL